MPLPRLLWDWGTAYDLFVSLDVLHHPVDFSVPGSWAAGARARLSAAEREILEQAQVLLRLPLHWLYTLPKPKDGAAVLWTLGQIPPAERLPTLVLTPDGPSAGVADALRRVAARGTWDGQDQEVIRTFQPCGKCDESPLSPQELATILHWWSRPEEFGERYLEGLRAYQEDFFSEEEERIRPALQAALSRAQEQAQRLALPELLEEVSQGLRFDALPEGSELVLAPSYWGTPLMFFGRVNAERAICLFGARPADASLVPGEMVPDTVLRVLNALSDSTRLRILHYLAQEPLSPAELSRRLRLRAPTVTHHLKTLRLAGLVQLTLGEGVEVKGYGIRPEAVAAAFAALEDFLEQDMTDPCEGSEPSQG